MKSSLSCPFISIPDIADDGITDLQERVLGLLEDADIPTETNDRIMALIAAAEKIKSER